MLKLYRFLKSLNKLDPSPDEVIIIDDHLNDQTPELLKRWRDIKSRFYKKIVIKAQNKGPAHSRNIGIEMASNNLIGLNFRIRVYIIIV